MNNKIIFFIISLFILSPSEMMGLNRLWRSFSGIFTSSNIELSEDDFRSATDFRVFRDPFSTHLVDHVLESDVELEKLNFIIKDHKLVEIEIKNNSNVKINIIFNFNQENNNIIIQDFDLSNNISWNFTEYDVGFFTIYIEFLDLEIDLEKLNIIFNVKDLKECFSGQKSCSNYSYGLMDIKVFNLNSLNFNGILDCLHVYCDPEILINKDNLNCRYYNRFSL
jgi:hypothetical protein